MSGLNIGDQRFAGDDGTADPRLAAILAAYAAGRESERAVLTALTGARLLVPLLERPASEAASEASEAASEVSEASEAGEGCDHRAAREMAFPTLIGRDGRPALLAFTSLAALVSWRPDARPVPAPAGQVWETAVADECAVMIDVAGPVPVAVDGARLAALAAGDPPPEPHTDPDIRADVAAALADVAAPLAAAAAAQPGGPAIAGADLAAGPDGSDLAVRLLLRAGPPRTAPGQPGQPEQRVQEAVRQAAEAIVARLAGRLRRGIQFSAVVDPRAPDAPRAPSGLGG
ncbi:MAG TPA: SseB family protein [Streptosporangiaceae bacterium]|nr:SseB family protein [Streptosporangiaceae bacterium]